MMLTTPTRAFTLIETLIYLALFSVLIGGIASAMYLLIQSSGKVQANAILLQEEQFIMATIERVVGAATTVSLPGAGGSGSTLMVNGNAITLSGTDVLLNGIAGELNNTNVRVTRLVFSRTAALPVGITTAITVETNTPNGQLLSYSASTTKYIRQ